MKIRTARGAGFAAIATLLAHWISYRLTLADPVARQHLLEETGHSWLGWGWPIAFVGLAVAATGSVLNRRIRATNSEAKTSRDALLLYLAGAGSFLAVELIERWQHMGDLDAVAANLLTRNGGLPVLLGILLMAAISPLFLAFERAVHRAFERRRETHPEVVSATYPTAVAELSNLFQIGACRTRGPPVLAGPGTTGLH